MSQRSTSSMIIEAIKFHFDAFICATSSPGSSTGCRVGNSAGALYPFISVGVAASCAYVSMYGFSLSTGNSDFSIVCSAPCFRFLSFINKNAMMASRTTTTAIPTPIPAFAPTLSAGVLDWACDTEDVGLGMGSPPVAQGGPPSVGVKSEGPVREVATAPMVVLALTDATEDDARLGTAVVATAASLNKLDVLLQQLFSPQHQLPSPQFRTGAFSDRY